jgi:hypothetical protein
MDILGAATAGIRRWPHKSGAGIVAVQRTMKQRYAFKIL